MPPVYEVYALRYAEHKNRLRNENFISNDEHDNSNMPLDFYCWLIRNHDNTIMVDTGFNKEMGVKRNRTYYASPESLLAKLNVDARSVEKIIVIHMHYDHIGNLLRDVREALRRAVEFAGLTAKSHRYFIEEFNPIINRVSFGPPLRRNQELLALLDAGIVELGGGPGAQIICDESKFRYVLSCEFSQQHYEKQVDVIIAARLDSYSPLSDASKLTQHLVKNGLITPFMNGKYHPGGIAIDKNLHPINVSGQTEEKLWAIGFLVEGAHYYTHALPLPHIQSRQFEDAEICVRGCIAHIINQNEFVVNKIEELI
ncbi:MBL fold metallo-hydrolase [Xenorhabdus koppenhoeferi]|uniref:MBL fold metallo-hydrolase n=1 Tax=Xenorhabdus koppenhoeferi TaxID=351659 RepID=UPI002B400AB5|nr:MBL fold metallo-hydrolase [Xenorhabdus sp. Vera]